MTEEGGREAGREVAADWWWCSGCYGFLRIGRLTGARPVLRGAPRRCGARGGRGRGKAGVPGPDLAHDLLVDRSDEDVGGAVDLVPGQEEGGDGAGRQALLFLRAEVFGDDVPGVYGACGADLAPFQAELVEQVKERGGAPVRLSA